ncbi:unnamed protein product, partial [Staurois parvus]
TTWHNAVRQLHTSPGKTRQSQTLTHRLPDREAWNCHNSRELSSPTALNKSSWAAFCA